MNIDKFGHHVHKRVRSIEPSYLFDKTLVEASNTETGLKLHSLKILQTPNSNDDAINKKYLDAIVVNFYTKQEIDKQVEVIKSQLFALSQQLQDKTPKKPDIENSALRLVNKYEQTDNNK